MASCSLIGNIPFDCRDAVGGIKEIKVKIHPGLSTIATNFTVTSGVVAITGTSLNGWYVYFVEKETADMTETINVNAAQGTRFFQQEIKLIFNKLSAKIRNEVNVLSQSPLLIAIRDMNDNYWLIGQDYGADMTAGVNKTGTARSDRSGSELTFTAKESQSILNMTSTTYGTLIT